MSTSANNRILLIDDNPDIHRDYVKILADAQDDGDEEDILAFLGEADASSSLPKLSLELHSAFSGEEGLQKVVAGCEQNKPYAMAFVDMRMPPGWDGLRTTEELWKTDPDLQIVICTAYSDNSWTDIIERVGRTDKLLILKKPFDAIEVSQLATALTEKWELTRQAKLNRDDLERLIQQRTKQLQHAALHDPLTDLPNRRFFQMRLSEAINNHKTKSPQVSVVLIDLDRFKQVNDSMGHPAGDDLLKAVSARLLEFTHEDDTAARLGGDEFALILRGEDAPSERKQFIQKIAKRMYETYSLPNGDVSCPASFGVASLPRDGTLPEELVRKADLALYRAKRERCGTVCFFNPDVDSKIVEARELETELRQAISNDEFVLFYQPIVSCQNQKIDKVEALIRWQHPTRGLLPPAEFIPLAESTGLIGPLGEWILDVACREATRWPDHVILSLNLSAAQFRKGNSLLGSIVKATSRCGLRPERLELEITESVLLRDTQDLIDTLQTLRELGVSITLDDFGIGYSNLNYLQRFPFNKLKLDRTFIKELGTSEDARMIVNAVARLGKSLGLETTAEGVETETQREIVIREGFDYFQGFLPGRPGPVADLETSGTSHGPIELERSLG